MSFAVDHVFVMCDVGAPEAAALAELGFVEGAPNRHPGRGTSNRRFFFDNSYLEILWVESVEEACSPQIAGTRLVERWNGRRRHCPFGVVLARASWSEPLPFRSWAYRPAYLPPGIGIEVAEETSLDEPLVFCLDSSGARGAGAAPIRIRSGPSKLTSIRMTLVPGLELSQTVRELEGMGLVSFERGRRAGLILEFDGGARGERAELRPRLPVELQW